MIRRLLKSFERVLKRILEGILLLFLKPRENSVPALEEIAKILVFRLDQRIGNGLLLLPLLNSIRVSHPAVTLHFLYHQPVAELIEAAKGNLLDRIWFYDQKNLLLRPWRLIAFFTRLRREKFDLVITSHNPDSFSLSQAIAGRWLKSRWLIGFDYRNSARYYDVAVKGSMHKHYAEAMVDLWRIVDPQAIYMPPALDLKSSAAAQGPEPGTVLLWLGATGSKRLPAQLAAALYDFLLSEKRVLTTVAAGPADEAHIARYDQRIRDKLIIWQRPLLETAEFFKKFEYFISPDTGPMHLAAALGLSTMTIFVDSDMTQYGYNDGVKQVSCSITRTAEDFQPVLDAVRQVLGQPSPTIAPITGISKGRG